MKILFSLITLAVLTSCEQYKEASSENKSQNQLPLVTDPSLESVLDQESISAKFVETDFNLPRCAEQILGELFYVRQTGFFRVCVRNKNTSNLEYHTVDPMRN